MALEASNEKKIERGIVKSDVREVVESLAKESFEKGVDSIVASPRTYILKRTITPQALEALGALYFENLLFDSDGELHFLTGRRERAVPEFTEEDAWEMLERQARSSRFILHNHPANSPAATRVSSGDINVSASIDTEIDFLVSHEGIIGYKPDLPEGYKRSFQDIVNVLQNPNRTIRQQKEAGHTNFFIPFRGDTESKRQLELICLYMNDPKMKWESLAKEING